MMELKENKFKKFTKKERNELKVEFQSMTRALLLEKLIDLMESSMLDSDQLELKVESLNKVIENQRTLVDTSAKSRDYFYNKCIDLSDKNSILRIKCERFKEEWMNAADHIFQTDAERELNNHEPIEGLTDGDTDENQADQSLK